MEQYKKAQVIMLPHKNIDTTITLYNNEELSLNNDRLEYHTNQHLCVISDDKIEDGDWVLNYFANQNTTVQVNGIKDVENRNNTVKCKKIIGTTDYLLFNSTKSGQCPSMDRLPQPSQQFIQKYIEAYNKGEVITDILVECEEDEDCQYCCGSGTTHGKDCHCIKLKLNSDNTINIKSAKESWTREDVSNLIHIFADYIIPNTPQDHIQYEKWLDKNLDL